MRDLTMVRKKNDMKKTILILTAVASLTIATHAEIADEEWQKLDVRSRAVNADL